METLHSNSAKNNVRRIQTLEEHRSVLKHVFDTAKERVLIVSPFISDSALSADRIPSLVTKAVNRHVAVNIFTDNNLNRETNGSFKRSAELGISSLVNAGAKVTVVDGIHNKTLARDNNLIAEGSFNWLSAVRTAGGVHQREERTLVVEGEEVKIMIEKELLGLKGQGLSAKSQHQNIPEAEEIGIGMKIFRWCFAIALFGFMLSMAVGPSGAGVSFLGYIGVILSFVLMYKNTQKQTKVIWPDYSKYSDGKLDLEPIDPFEDGPLSKEFHDSLTAAGYIGIFERDN